MLSSTAAIPANALVAPNLPSIGQLSSSSSISAGWSFTSSTGCDPWEVIWVSWLRGIHACTSSWVLKTLSEIELDCVDCAEKGPRGGDFGSFVGCRPKPNGAAGK